MCSERYAQSKEAQRLQWCRHIRHMVVLYMIQRDQRQQQRLPHAIAGAPRSGYHIEERAVIARGLPAGQCEQQTRVEEEAGHCKIGLG